MSEFDHDEFTDEELRVPPPPPSWTRGLPVVHHHEYHPRIERNPDMAIDPATTDDTILEYIKEHQRKTAALIEELERRKKPHSPGPGRYSMKARFSTGGKEYEYLVLILADGRVYTTGGGEFGYQKDWTGFVKWLKTEGVKARSLQRLETVSTIPCTTVGLA